MELVDRFTTNLYDTFASFDIYQGIRLVMVIGGYMLIRNFASKELAKRHLEAQVRHDREEKHKQQEAKLIERPVDDVNVAEASTFGWGNKTRYRVKKQQEKFEQAIDSLKQQQQQLLNGDDDDEDIRDLLED